MDNYSSKLPISSTSQSQCNSQMLDSTGVTVDVSEPN